MSKINWKPGNMLYPLPAVMISCQEKNQKPNIITVAWAGTICSDPVMVSISVRKERYSHDIIKNTGEFVINL
ncbi:MAG: flavin reductase, partial [Lachnospiraceae bacterium]|nr:flavin reductase [Lachnospiraceae bacterium]